MKLRNLGRESSVPWLGRLKFGGMFRIDPAFAIPAEFSDKIGENLGSFFRRDVAAVLEDDEAGIQDRIMEFVPVIDRDYGVFLAPNDEGWLVYEVRIALDPIGMPVPRGCEKAPVSIRRLQRAKN